MKKEKKIEEALSSRARRYFISGIVIFLPLALTVNLFILTINFADGILGSYFKSYFSKEFGFYFRGLSILISLLLIFIIGFLASNFLGRRIYPFFEGLLLRLPFFKQVYPAFKEMSLFLFSGGKKINFERVALVEYPRAGMYQIAFLTNNAPKSVNEKLSQDMCCLFLPTTPSPLTGWVVFVPRKDIIFPDISVEDAIRIVVSGGVVTRSS